MYIIELIMAFFNTTSMSFVTNSIEDILGKINGKAYNCWSNHQWNEL